MIRARTLIAQPARVAARAWAGLPVPPLAALGVAPPSALPWGAVFARGAKKDAKGKDGGKGGGGDQRGGAKDGGKSEAAPSVNLSAAANVKDLERRMAGAESVFAKEVQSVRAGGAEPSLLDRVVVNVFGSDTPVSQLGTVTKASGTMLAVNAFDPATVPAIVEAIRGMGLNLNPQPDGNVVRVPVPKPTKESRQALAKMVMAHAEKARVSVRNVRRDGLDKLKRAAAGGGSSKDESARLEKEIDKTTDAAIKRITDAANAKAKELTEDAR